MSRSQYSNVRVLLTLACIQDQNIEASLREKELMGGMHDLLTTEVPYVQADLLTPELALTKELSLYLRSLLSPGV
jgi:hypothetical protein